MVEVAKHVYITLFAVSESHNHLLYGRYFMEYSVYDDHEV